MKPENAWKKIALFLSSSESSGGAFSYERSLLELLGEVCRNEGHELVVFRLLPDQTFSRLSARGPAEAHLTADRWIPVRLPGRFRLSGKRSSTGFADIENYLLQNNFSLVYGSAPTRWLAAISRIPFIATVLDLGHRELPELPEFSGKVWASREAIFQSSLPRAFHVFTDSLVTAERLIDLYSVQPQRVSPLGLLFEGFPQRERADLAERNLGPYFIYPAKMWAHKNHLMLLDAFQRVLATAPDCKLLFTGVADGDMTLLVERRISELGLASSVVNLGHVEILDLSDLIRDAVALLMPTLLGPTNIPPLQALSLGTPVIVSDVHAFGAGLDEHMIKVPASDSAAWSQQMLNVIENRPLRVPLRLSNQAAKDELANVLDLFFQRQRVWRLD